MITIRQKREALDAIMKANGGHLDADLVIAAARDKTNVLHGLFNWDRDAAALEHWRDVARSIMREVRVEMVVENRTISAVAYVRDPARPTNEAGYVALTSIERRSADARAIIQNEVDRIIPAIQRAQEIADCLGLRRDLDALLANALALRTKIERKATPLGKAKPRDVAARLATRRREETKPRHA